MVDAYTIGITLALDNGVSEGLTSIRRDLVALNGVVEGSAMRLKDLTRAAADLQVDPGAEPFKKNSAALTRRHGDGSVPRSSGSAGLDPSLFAPSRSDLLMAAQTFLSMSSPPTAAPFADIELTPENRPLPVLSHAAALNIADVGLVPPNQLSTTFSDGSPIAPGVTSAAKVPASVPTWNQRSDQGAPDANFVPVRYPAQIPPLMLNRAAPGEGLSGGLFTNPGAAPLPPSIPDARSALASPLREGPNISLTFGGKHPAPRVLPQRAADLQRDPTPTERAILYDGSAIGQPPSSASRSPSAIPPSTEPQSATLQGDIYVDGARLGRWMTDRLAKAAELPRAAMTGFDPRMTPTWPGAPVGA